MGQRADHKQAIHKDAHVLDDQATSRAATRLSDIIPSYKLS